jgi:hypothetical protein
VVAIGGTPRKFVVTVPHSVTHHSKKVTPVVRACHHFCFSGPQYDGREIGPVRSPAKP